MHATLYIAASNDWRKVRNLFLAVCLVCATAQSQADTWLNIGGVSKHFSGQQFNESNPGLGIETDALGLTFAVGAYHNSIGKRSQYITAETVVFEAGGLKFGVLAGAVDGYYLNNGGFVPLVLPTVRWDGEVFGLRVVALPQVGDKVAAAVAVQLRIRIQ